MGEDSWSVALFSQRSERSASTKYTRVTNRYHRDQDDDIQIRVKSGQGGISSSNHEWRRGRVDEVAGTKQASVIRSNQEANECQCQNTKEGDPSKDLLDCRREGFKGCSRFYGYQADQLSSSKVEGGGDEDGTKALESVAKCATIVPVPIDVSIHRNSRRVSQT